MKRNHKNSISTITSLKTFKSQPSSIIDAGRGRRLNDTEKIAIQSQH